ETIYSALLIDIATTDAPPLRSLRPQVPIELEAIVHRAMAREREQRFPSVTAFLQALEDLPRTDVWQAPARMSGANSGRILLAEGGGLGANDSGRIAGVVTPIASRSRNFASAQALA